MAPIHTISTKRGYGRERFEVGRLALFCYQARWGGDGSFPFPIPRSPQQGVVKTWFILSYTLRGGTCIYLVHCEKLHLDIDPEHKVMH